VLFEFSIYIADKPVLFLSASGVAGSPPALDTGPEAQSPIVEGVMNQLRSPRLLIVMVGRNVATPEALEIP